MASERGDGRQHRLLDEEPAQAGCLASIELSAGAAGSTAVAVNVDYELKWGPFGKLFGSVVHRQLTKWFEGLLRDLETAVSSKV